MHMLWTKFKKPTSLLELAADNTCIYLDLFCYQDIVKYVTIKTTEAILYRASPKLCQSALAGSIPVILFNVGHFNVSAD